MEKLAILQYISKETCLLSMAKINKAIVMHLPSSL